MLRKETSERAELFNFSKSRNFHFSHNFFLIVRFYDLLRLLSHSLLLLLCAVSFEVKMWDRQLFIKLHNSKYRTRISLYRSPTRICSQLNFFLKSFLRSSAIYISRITHSETFKTSTCGRKEKKKFVLLGAICVATAPLASHYKPWISCFV